MNKRGQGFMNGFWSAESSALTSDAANNWLDNKLVATTTWEKDFTGIAEKGILGGAVSRFGRKTFSSGFFTGFGAEALKMASSDWRNLPEIIPRSRELLLHRQCGVQAIAAEDHEGGHHIPT